MPTSKDILTGATKTYKDNQITPSVYQDAVKNGITDVAEYAKAAAVLSTSMRSMQGLITEGTNRLKKLNAALSELQKAAPIMKAPVDAKVYNQLVNDLKSEIKDGMDAIKKVQDQLSKAQSICK